MDKENNKLSIFVKVAFVGAVVAPTVVAMLHIFVGSLFRAKP